MTALAWLLALACAASAGQETRPEGSVAIELVESAPIETSLDHPDIRNADVVWLEMIEGARKTLDFAQFYASDRPGSRLEPIVVAIEKAAERGVAVRFLAAESFYATYPETLDRLARTKGLEMRRYDMKKATGGGVLHAKYFVVDGHDVFLGSQNFDWRSLEHIQELGVRIRSIPFSRAIMYEFGADWEIAGGAEAQVALFVHRLSLFFPDELSIGDETVRIAPAFSPKNLLVYGSHWDLPQILRLIEGSQRTVRVQLLTYKTTTRDGYWGELESALRSAAARGVKVELLLADWCKRKGTIEGLQSLEVLPNVDVKLVTIPPWTGGFVPFGRVIHAKYMVVDGEHAWLGTSNWEKDYFYASRNVGLIVEGKSFAAQLERFFADGWNGPYAKPVDPCAVYEVPKIGEEK